MLSRHSPQLLRELKDAHDSLFEAVHELGLLSRGPRPSEQQLADARLKVSRASIAKRLLWGRILGHLAPNAGREAEHALRQIQEADIQLIKAAVNHVAAWKATDAILNWAAYSHAASAFLPQIVANITIEKRLLYPMLEETESEPA